MGSTVDDTCSGSGDQGRGAQVAIPHAARNLGSGAERVEGSADLRLLRPPADAERRASIFDKPLSEVGGVPQLNTQGQRGNGIMSSASSASSLSQCGDGPGASPTRRSIASVESAVTNTSAGSAPTGHGNIFSFGGLARQGPASPPGPVEKAFKSFGKNLGDAARSLLPGSGKENMQLDSVIAAPQLPQASYQPYTPYTPKRTATPTQALPPHAMMLPQMLAPDALPITGMTPGAVMAGGFGRVPSSRGATPQSRRAAGA